jgi:hypothetical protein
VLKASCIPKPTNKPFQKFDVNLASRFDMIILGMPCNLKKIFYEYISNIYGFIRGFNGDEVSWLT